MTRWDVSFIYFQARIVVFHQESESGTIDVSINLLVAEKLTGFCTC